MSSFDRNSTATQRWRMDLAYDGQGLNGFAEQPGGLTVVGLLRSALARTLRLVGEPEVTGAGRTDAGVHAYAQVVHVDLPENWQISRHGHSPDALRHSLNRQLAGRVRIERILEVDADFHARFSAQWRQYRYIVVESADPALNLENAWSWSVAGPLDLAAMNEAGASALGVHDFRAFCRRPDNKSVEDPLLRDVQVLRWERIDDVSLITSPHARAVKLTIRAQSFCHNMVRCLTSTMVAVGRGKFPVEILAQRLESHDRSHMPAPAPARGLSLVGVGYDQFAGGPSGFVD